MKRRIVYMAAIFIALLLGSIWWFVPKPVPLTSLIGTSNMDSIILFEDAQGFIQVPVDTAEFSQSIAPYHVLHTDQSMNLRPALTFHIYHDGLTSEDMTVVQLYQNGYIRIANPQDRRDQSLSSSVNPLPGKFYRPEGDLGTALYSALMTLRDAATP